LGISQSVHLIGNMLIEFSDDDHALSECYSVAFHHYRKEAVNSRADIVGQDAAAKMGEMTSLIVGRLIDRFARVGGVWRIAHRQAVFETAKIEEGSRNLLPHWLAAQRDESDPLYAARAAMNLPPMAEW
jgi:hypothetical protein